jgi:hypothetical protein
MLGISMRNPERDSGTPLSLPGTNPAMGLIVLASPEPLQLIDPGREASVTD